MDISGDLNNESALITHNSLYINGDNQFISANGVINGKGTKTNPYIINNWKINASKDHGIWIENTNSYFIIKNCYVFDGLYNEQYKYGIFLNNVKNGTIINNRIKSNSYGIYLRNSCNNRIINNSVHHHSEGIYLIGSNDNIISKNIVNDYGSGIHIGGYFSDKGSNNNIIFNNTIFDNYYGLSLSFSNNNLIYNNTIYNNTYNLGIWGEEINHYIHTISSNNTINKIPIYYWVKKSKKTIPLDAECVGLIDCNNITINNINANNNFCGIILINSTNCKISNNKIHNNSLGIFSYYSHNNEFYNNILNNNLQGMNLINVKNERIEKNTFIKQDYGIYLKGSSSNIINDNRCDSNEIGGFHIELSNNNIIHNNIFNSKMGNGILNILSDSNSIQNNKFLLKNSTGIGLSGSKSVSIKNNIMISCSLFINGYELSHWNSHTIEINNIANNEQINYWKNIRNKRFPSVKGEIILANCSNISIENQKIKSECIGIQIGFSSKIKISKNSCNGIFVSGSEKNIISNNTCKSISISTSNYNTISNNNCDSSESTGIYLLYSESNEITNNMLVNNMFGINVDANLNNINNNTFSKNFYGVYLTSSENNVFKHNNNSNNKIGINLELESNNNKFIENSISNNSKIGFSIQRNSKDNIIHHNNFISNFKQALDNGTNQWDNSISGGNYWSDWTTPDIDNDGIIDISYEIPGTGGSEDNYPLSKKYILFPNLPPKINHSIGNFEIFEDITFAELINLYDWFFDPNGDQLSFNVQNSKNISVTINNNGTVVLTPKKDWNGYEILIFFANDSIYEINDNVNISVIGVNDPPAKPHIFKPLDNESFEISTKINFSGYCFDADEIYGDILNYTWTSNISGIIGFGKKIENVTFPSGYHKIKLNVSDLMNKFNQTNITIKIYNQSSSKNGDMYNITNNFTDTDKDMIPDNWERKYGLNITDQTDAQLDFDKDNLTNLEEFSNHTNPFDPDTDNDGYNDGLEVDKGTDPLDDKDYPSKEDVDKEKESIKMNYSMYIAIIGIIILILILMILYVNIKRK